MNDTYRVATWYFKYSYNADAPVRSCPVVCTTKSAGIAEQHSLIAPLQNPGYVVILVSIWALLIYYITHLIDLVLLPLPMILWQHPCKCRCHLAEVVEGRIQFWIQVLKVIVVGRKMTSHFRYQPCHPCHVIQKEFHT